MECTHLPSLILGESAARSGWKVRHKLHSSRKRRYAPLRSDRQQRVEVLNFDATSFVPHPHNRVISSPTHRKTIKSIRRLPGLFMSDVSSPATISIRASQPSFSSSSSASSGNVPAKQTHQHTSLPENSKHVIVTLDPELGPVTIPRYPQESPAADSDDVDQDHDLEKKENTRQRKDARIHDHEEHGHQEESSSFHVVVAHFPRVIFDRPEIGDRPLSPLPAATLLPPKSEESTRILQESDAHEREPPLLPEMMFNHRKTSIQTIEFQSLEKHQRPLVLQKSRSSIQLRKSGDSSKARATSVVSRLPNDPHGDVQSFVTTIQLLK